MTNSKASKELWDSWWEAGELPEPMNPHQPHFRNYRELRLHKYFSEVFAKLDTKKMRLLEIGCARSDKLPYFAKEFDFQVFGIDYSELGCQQAEKILQKAQIEGKIVCSDFFNPAENLLESFDVVISFGVAEHFPDTVGCITAFSRFLKPNGILIALIPNQTGSIGFFQKILDRHTYDIHVLLDRHLLQLVHEDAGLKVNKCGYFLSTHFGVLNLSHLNPQHSTTKIKAFVMNSLSRISKLVWAIEYYTAPLPETKIFAPYIIYVAQKIVLNH
jgi:cyclopropane fatty-acyl-phospholipid synthase-like methyltransferase